MKFSTDWRHYDDGAGTCRSYRDECSSRSHTERLVQYVIRKLLQIFFRSFVAPAEVRHLSANCIMRHSLQLFPYKIQTCQLFSAADINARETFTIVMLGSWILKKSMWETFISTMKCSFPRTASSIRTGAFGVQLIPILLYHHP